MTVLVVGKDMTKKFCRIVGTCRNTGDEYVQLYDPKLIWHPVHIRKQTNSDA
jgi:hypothetical protein